MPNEKHHIFALANLMHALVRLPGKFVRIEKLALFVVVTFHRLRQNVWILVHRCDVLLFQPERTVADVQGFANLIRQIRQTAMTQVLGKQDRITGLHFQRDHPRFVLWVTAVR